MHPARLAFALLAVSFALPTFAVEELDIAALNSAVAMQRQVTEAQRTMIIADNIQLTTAESEEFWPVYREYRADVAKLNDRFVKLVTDYARSYESMDDDTAARLLKESFAIEAGRVKASKKNAKKLGRFLSGVTVVRFVQIESRLDAVMELKIKNSIPLAM
jgi:threonine dehydratase